MRRIVEIAGLLAGFLLVLSAPVGDSARGGLAGGSVAWATSGGLPGQGLLWVANEGGTPATGFQSPSEISIVDPVTGLEVDLLPLKLDATQGSRPIDTVFSPDGKTAYIPAQASSQVWVFDVASRTALAVIPIPTNAQPHDTALSPNGKLLFVSTLSDQFVPIVDTSTLTIVGHLDAGSNPDTTLPARTHIVEVGPDRRWLLTVNHNADTITFFDLKAIERDPTGIHTPVSLVQTGGRPQHLVFTYSGQRFFLTAGLENQVEAYDFDATTGQATFAAETAVGAGPTFIALTPAEDRLFVTNTGVTDPAGPNITVLDPNTLATLGTIADVPRANHIALSANGRTVFVTSGIEDFVAEIDAVTLSIQQIIDVGREPHGVVIQAPGSGRSGSLQAVFPISNFDDTDDQERVDPYGVAVRR